jgi:hypothetical protein
MAVRTATTATPPMHISPRRSCASSRCAFSMARSPPLTATYIVQALATMVVRGNAGRSAMQPDLVVQFEQSLGGQPEHLAIGVIRIVGVRRHERQAVGAAGQEQGDDDALVRT